MAHYLRYTYQVYGIDSTLVAFNDTDHAKTILDFSQVDFTGLTPEWTLENSNKTLCLKVPFSDAQALVPGTQQQADTIKAFHTNMKDTWKVGIADATDSTLNGYGGMIDNIDNKYVISDSEI